MSTSSSTSSEAVASPCVRRCCLNDQEQCLGCGRLLGEILEWGNAARSRRMAIRDAAARRLAEASVSRK
ncbi:DUF1289 domain-containing protein [Pseudomonas sp. LRF_L74]|uniref:DUF1289 domain-containing protein n=1 Tax=Pseudomonas sp. LRF_L74 TaxID=3369422 RepID=UPI003F61BBCC